MRLLRALAVIAILLGPAPATAADLATFGRLPQIEDIAVSADGKTLALAETDGAKRTIVFYDVATGHKRAQIPAGSVKVRDIRWVGSDDLLLVNTVTSDIPGTTAPRAEYAVGTLYRLSTNTLRPLLQTAKGLQALNILVDDPDVRLINGKPQIFVQGIVFQAGKGARALFRIDPGTGAASLLNVSPFSTEDIFIDARGEVGASSAYYKNPGVTALIVRGKTAPAPRNYHGGMEILGPGRGPASVLVSYEGETSTVLAEFDLGRMTWGEPMEDLDENDAVFEQGASQFVGYRRLTGDDLNYTFFDPADTAMWNAVRSVYPRARIDFIDRSLDRGLVVVRVDRRGEGPFFAMIDLKKNEAAVLGAAYGDLTPDAVSPVLPIRYKAQDGLEITGYLTVPRSAGANPRNLPLIVMPHGGPVARDEPGFDWWAQAMAFQGYVVLQPNYRGSDGFGRTFLEAGMGEVGRKMQTDLSDGVRYLVSEGLIDPARVCIVGASYGGYAALAGATFDRGVYRCAVSVAGVSDLRTFMSTMRKEDGERAFRGWNHLLGVDTNPRLSLASLSPITRVRDITIPVLLIHGRDDTVVRYGQSFQMEQEMRKNGKPVELLTLAGEDHYLSRGETRYQMLQRIAAFLEKHNPATPATAAPAVQAAK